LGSALRNVGRTSRSERERNICLPGTVSLAQRGRRDLPAADPLADITELQRIRFVMKAGQIIRNDLNPP